MAIRFDGLEETAGSFECFVADSQADAQVGEGMRWVKGPSFGGRKKHASR